MGRPHLSKGRRRCGHASLIAWGRKGLYMMRPRAVKVQLDVLYHLVKPSVAQGRQEAWSGWLAAKGHAVLAMPP
jgi:hypothetical protein